MNASEAKALAVTALYYAQLQTIPNVQVMIERAAQAGKFEITTDLPFTDLDVAHFAEAGYEVEVERTARPVSTSTRISWDHV